MLLNLKWNCACLIQQLPRKTKFILLKTCLLLFLLSTFMHALETYLSLQRDDNMLTFSLISSAISFVIYQQNQNSYRIILIITRRTTSNYSKRYRVYCDSQVIWILDKILLQCKLEPTRKYHAMICMQKNVLTVRNYSRIQK